MKRIVHPVLLVFILLSSTAYATVVNDSTNTHAGNTMADHKGKSEARYFTTLNPPVLQTTDPIVLPAQTPDDSVEYHRKKALMYEAEVMQNQATVETLNSLGFATLPVGIQRTVGGISYTIIVSRLYYTMGHAFIEAYCMLELPQTGDKIAFRGAKLPFSNTGGFEGTGRLELIGSYHVKLSDKILLTLEGKGNTFVEFDCNGFKGIGIEAALEFSRDLLVPENQDGSIIPSPERVRTSFITVAQGLTDLLVGVNIPPFQVSSLNGVGFSVQEAFYDMSTLANPPGIAFPAGYTSPYFEAGLPALWQGLYLKRTEVRLPPAFTKKRDPKSRITLGVENMLIDDQGFSGKIFGEHLIEAGDMNGWAYTLDRAAIELVTNSVQGFELMGKISVPVIKTKEGKPTQFGYLAHRGADGNYIFGVKVENEVKLPLFVADVKLFQGSTITVTERNNQFYPSAILNGELTIRAAKAALNSIRFEQLIISSETPKFQPGTFGFGSEGQSSSASGYPLAITNIGVKSQGERVGIAFDVSINIGGKPEEEGFKGTAMLTVWGKREAVPVKDAEGQIIGTDEGNWKYDKVEISGVAIAINKPGVISLKGSIQFFEEDATYGDGFKGTVSGKIYSVTVMADALFGKTPTYRYWYADALVKLDNGIPLAPGFSAYGFGGGFYSKVKQTTQGGSAIGKTQSGITYVPDENSMGIKAMMVVGTAVKPEPFNGDVSLEVMMNRHGGINSITLKGNAKFMAGMGDVMGKIKDNVGAAVQGRALDKLMDLAQGQVYGSMLLQYDNVNDIFHGNLEIFVNIAFGLVRGVSPGNKAGWATIHFSKDEWYILIGTPDQPIGLEVARIFKSRSYFMMGDNLPGSPPPPPQVSQILGDIDLDYTRDLNALGTGSGIAFGLHFGVDTGDLRFLMFYGRFSAGTGIDFMLKDYGENYHCKGSEGPIGIGGWYANGQAYAFVQGKIGIRVKLKFYKGDFDIIDIGAAAILQAKGPNPFWMKGTVGGYYNILGGLVKGNCKFDVTIGDDCKIVPNGSPLENVNIIAEVSPVKGTTDVDVFNAPQAAFNIPLGQVFELVDADDRRHYYRGNLKSFVITDGASPIEGTLRWNADADVVAFDSRDILPPKKEMKAVIRVAFEERIGSEWKTVTYDGQTTEEVKETTFTTGTAPDFIPPSNVAYSYPIAGQYNFYPQEYNKGFIKLKKGQPYLFNPGPGWTQKVMMTDVASQRYVDTNLSYNAAETTVNFNMPTGFQPAKLYSFEIMNLPKQNVLLDANVKKVETNVGANSDGNETIVTTKTIEGNLELKDAKSIYASHFRTSKYATFVEKMQRINLASGLSNNAGNNVLYLLAYWRGDEFFDAFEIGEGENQINDRLIHLEADLRGNTWYDQNIYPLIYEGYPLAGFMNIRNRNVTLLGNPPVKEIYLLQNKNDLTVSSSGEVPNASSYFQYSRIRYMVTQSMFMDYIDIQNQVANYLVTYSVSLSPRYSNLLVSRYPQISFGDYKIKLTYRIPGINVSTSTYETVLSYPRN
jgi:hypothetical protein